MSKRKVKFSEQAPSVSDKEPAAKRLKENHAVDSDEEEPAQIGTKIDSDNVLKEDDIEGNV